MSHELRRLSNAIIGMTELLSGNELTARQRNYVEKINESAEALLGTISSILDFSKIEAGKIQLDSRRFDVESIVCFVVNTFLAQIARQKGLRLHLFRRPGCATHLVGDPDRLRQILLNLIGNAVKFAAQGRVVVRALAGDANGSTVEVRFEIDDTGIGISSDALPKLFQPFVQLMTPLRASSAVRASDSRSQSASRNSWGTIAVTSELAVGSRFSFVARFGVPPG